MDKAPATEFRNKRMRRADPPEGNHMHKLKVRASKKSLLTLMRSHQWVDKMVYLLAANKSHKYKNGRSRILYIGTTKKGADRPAASAVNKASEAFYELRGVRTIDVHIVTCSPRKAMQTWKRLESALLDVFRDEYFELPKYNKVRPTLRVGLFSRPALEKIISKFDVE
jgi:flavin-binding protein dodecin